MLQYKAAVGSLTNIEFDISTLKADAMKSLAFFCCLTFALVCLTEGAPSRVARPTDPEAYLKFLGTARDVLDRVPLIDGYTNFKQRSLFNSNIV